MGMNVNRASIGHVLVGGFVSVVLFSLPGGPAIGGGVAGYLESERLERGAVIGVFVGLLAAGAVAVVSLGVFELALRPGIDPRFLPFEFGGATSEYQFRAESGVTLPGGLVGMLGLLITIYSLVLAVGGSLLGSYLKSHRKASSAA